MREDENIKGEKIKNTEIVMLRDKWGKGRIGKTT